MSSCCLTADPVRIAVGKNQKEFDRLAKEELVSAIAKMTGSSPGVFEADSVSGKGIIYLGDTDFARTNGVVPDTFDPEEWEIRHIDGNLIITGGTPVGTLYGVYRFLNRNGYYFLTEDAEAVPRKKEISFSGFDERKKPVFAGRNIYDAYVSRGIRGKMSFDSYNRFRLRNFVNGQQSRRQEAPYLGKWFLMGGPGDYHTYYKYLPPELYKTHPEYFNMGADGKRFLKLPQESQPCLSNPDVIRIMTDHLRQYIQKDRENVPKEKWPRIYDISRMDGTSFICKCPACMKIYEEEGGDAGIELRCINAIASEIAKIYPDVMIRTFAYASGENAPKLVKPEKNVIVQYCDLYTKSDPYRPLSHHINKDQSEKMEDWVKKGGMLALWDYWNMGGPSYNNPPRPEIIVDAIIGDMKLFRQYGIKTLFLEAEKDFMTPQPFIDLHYFLGYQLMLDPDQDAEKLIDVYMKNFYGAAALLMGEYFNLLREGVKEYPRAQKTMQVSAWKYMTPKSYLHMIDLLEKAEKTVACDSTRAARVRAEMLSPLWCVLFFWNDCQSEFVKSGYSKKSLVERCRVLALESLGKGGPKNLPELTADLDKRLFLLSAELPVPEAFRCIPASALKIFGYPHAKAYAPGGAVKVKDTESPTGWTVSSENKDPLYHGASAVQSRIPCLQVAVANIGNGQKGIMLKDLPSDEKYHWYLIPKARIGGKTTLWAHFWFIQFDLSSAYANADGREDLNDYDVWFSARFTGPAYVPGSTKKNAIAMDCAVLVRADTPEAEALRKKIKQP